MLDNIEDKRLYHTLGLEILLFLKLGNQITKNFFSKKITLGIKINIKTLRAEISALFI